MNNNDSQVPHIERLDFFNGQRLFAEDLQTLDGFNRQMRWLHNRSLHTFGIGSGFVVRGERGDREVTISPGYAIDNEGREIILLLPRVETVPPVAGDGAGNPRFYDLTVHYPRSEDLEELETRGGLCSTHGVVRRREEPVFCWIELKSDLTPVIDKHAAQIANGEKIVLARISVKNCRLETLSIATRRNVRPERLPYVACGRTPAGGSNWQLWVIDIPDGNGSTFSVVIGVYLDVDTSSAKFASLPCYSARVAGERIFLNYPNADPSNFSIEGFSMIDSGPSTTHFILRVLFPRQGEFNPISDDGIVANTGIKIDTFVRMNAQWYVEWMGVEG